MKSKFPELLIIVSYSSTNKKWRFSENFLSGVFVDISSTANSIRILSENQIKVVVSALSGQKLKATRRLITAQIGLESANLTFVFTTRFQQIDET
jgi:hypothetical protein